MTLDLTRRSLFVGLGATLLAAPAVVRIPKLLMPIRAWVDPAPILAHGGGFRLVQVGTSARLEGQMPNGTWQVLEQLHTILPDWGQSVDFGGRFITPFGQELLQARVFPTKDGGLSGQLMWTENASDNDTRRTWVTQQHGNVSLTAWR